MRRTLRSRLFLALLGCVLLAVGASLALGVVLTRSAVRDTIRGDVERQADALAEQLSEVPAGVRRLRQVPGIGVPAGPGAGGRVENLPDGGEEVDTPGAGGTAAQGAPPGGGPPANGPPPGEGPDQGVRVFGLAAAARLLPDDAAASLRSTGAADGSAEIDGREQIYAARRIGSSVVLVTRPDVVSGDDFSRYLSALLIAGGAAALLAAAVAALLARRLTQPLRRLGAAAGELAAGRHPEPVPREGTEELDELATAFNGMSEQLGRAREAERSVLLSVSHDLRTPLTSIRGYAEGLEDGTVTPAEAAAVVGGEAARLERLVGDLLALARLRQGVLEIHREEVDLAALAREARQRLAPRARAAAVEIAVAGGPAPARADGGRVLQVLTNLVENAVRVSPPGSAVEIAVAPGRVEVADRGPGIPAAELDQAFERFHLRSRSGGVGEGAGLGLAIVRELSGAMGGGAAVANRPGGGASFTITLPTQD